MSLGFSTAEGVSAVIAHHGAVAVTEALVSDLLAQSYQPIDVIVSDDASATAYPETAGVTVIRSEINGGYGAAINRGVRVANRPWLLVLNSDVRLDEGFLERAMQSIEGRPPSVYGFRHRSAAGYVASAAPLPTLASTLGQNCDAFQPLARRIGWDRAWRKEDPADKSTRQVGWVSGAAMLMPTSMFRSVGGFDERYFMYSEEVDLQRRLFNQGVGSILIGDVELEHVGGASTESLDGEVELLRSRLLYEEIARGVRSRKLLEVGLRTVLTVDYGYQHIRRLIDQDQSRVSRLVRRRQILVDVEHANRSREEKSMTYVWLTSK